MPDQPNMMAYSHVSTAPISHRSVHSEERIQPDPASSPERSPKPPLKMTDKVKYESTVDGDIRTIVVEEASFDADEGKKSRDPQQTANDGQESSHKTPIKKRTHTRDLSAHFFDATRLSDDNYPSQHSSRPDHHQKSPLTAYPSPNVGQKHRRGFSGDVSNPVMAHRRVNSIGDSQFVGRSFGYYGSYQPHHSAMYYNHQNQHRREGSAGLDMLSIAAEASKDDARSVPENRTTGIPSRPGNSPSAVSNASSSFEQPAPRAPFSQHGPYPAYYGPQQHGYYDQMPPHYRGVPPSPSQYPMQFAPPRGGRYAPHHKEAYAHLEHNRPGPVPEEGQRLDTDETLFQKQSKEGQTRGVQTFVTSIAVGDGGRTMKAAPTHRTASTNTEQPMHAPIPTTVSRHHRKDSSFSSLATIMGSGIFPDPGEQQSGKHYRSDTAGSMSFLKGLDSPDEIFLSNVSSQQPPNEVQATFSPPRPVPVPSSVAVSSTGSGRVLAQGGTSKRVRRKCTMEGCPNRVVQGGLCIAHGAKRKQCKHPGCTKNVKKAGLCSTHGPARKRCEFADCAKVAVQGGRCIAHGAKKKLCSVDNCTKQAIMTGMCKKHHDQSQGVVHRGRRKSSDEEDSVVTTCVAIKKEAPSGKANLGPSHQRGLSIFQEMSAESVSTLLSTDEQASEASSSVHPLKM
uniref:WRKY19-like zinc finger domain-containing protein n=1 Tax=Grammatophora oceanica TaxID=210454 RepID=A0A7S1VN87_9STRA|mmetsp:Transcript_49729/g.74126  ORF Transcript_49729/g.74126 Transcript_49729/m.74126 type:complete len:678 (+) Transcript_49729:221-2254(+)|eukprot:CAMPEP_0194031480 /NCGR_PEP_ID=MMETSP0009_2-20130614/4639_1 /TAXON_ID=210454 /ORGANISM="Grammatophora oceanica, Strain CCMP 410" /LENGTH=677 /DNA_ID=CAMNT_0038671639 /DNA_START=524 /DNA_END=2557 /DNA_ORIENTATION=-